VPDIRRNGSQALRAASEELQKLAQRMDDHRAAAAERPPTPPPEASYRDKGETKP
jgi:hypothetical protein